MEGSFYNINQLFVATKEPFDPSLAPQSAQHQSLVGIYQEEESVDFSALVEACEKTTEHSPINFGGSGSGSASGPLSSSSFFDTTESAFPFEPLMPGLNMYGNENGYQNPASLADFTSQQVLTTPQPSHQQHSLSDTLMVGKDPAPGKVKTGKPSSKKGNAERGSLEYREKRDRNNIAVRKSRIKSKQRVLETERRVKELEEENGHLQNKIALLTKELNVLKGLFASAGVPHPPMKMEMDSLPCKNGK